MLTPSSVRGGEAAVAGGRRGTSVTRQRAVRVEPTEDGRADVILPGLRDDGVA